MIRMARLQNCFYCASCSKFEWQSRWRFEFRVYPP